MASLTKNSKIWNENILNVYIMFDIILNYYVRNATPLLLNRFDCFLHWSIWPVKQVSIGLKVSHGR